MTLFVECTADETTAIALGALKRCVTHYSGKDELCKALANASGVTGMVDEDPLSRQPPYLKALKDSDPIDGLKPLLDPDRNNRVVLICPKLEDWLLATAKDVGVNLTDFGFTATDSRSLHAEINDRLGSLKKLLDAFLRARSRRALRLQELMCG